MLEVETIKLKIGKKNVVTSIDRFLDDEGFCKYEVRTKADNREFQLTSFRKCVRISRKCSTSVLSN